MAKRRPELKRENNDSRFHFRTIAKLREVWQALEKQGIWCRQSGRFLIVEKRNRNDIQKIISDLAESN